jgi:hypothetical protein
VYVTSKLRVIQAGRPAVTDTLKLCFELALTEIAA